MSLASMIGMGYSGYAVLRGVPLLLLPSGTPEDEHLLKSDGAFNPDPAQNTGQIPARQKRSLNVALQTIVTPNTLALLKPITYGWRSEDQMDGEPEVPFTYVVGAGEGFTGQAHIDDVTITAEPESLVTMTVNLTSWTWQEIGSSDPLSRGGTPVLNPILDSGYRPVAGWNCAVFSTALGTAAIVRRFSLRLANNWNYQGFLAGYAAPPNPALIVAGNLDVSLDISWMAERQDRPRDSGAFQICIGGDRPSTALDTIYLDRMVREPRNFDGGGAHNQLITWQSTYFLSGPKPRSN